MMDRIPFPEKLVNYFDIAKGIGEVMLHGVFDAIHHEAHPSDSEHFLTDAVAPEPYSYDGIERPPGT